MQAMLLGTVSSMALQAFRQYLYTPAKPVAAKLAEVKTITMPIQVQNDSTKKTEFMKQVSRIQTRDNVKFKVNLQDPNVQLMKVPKEVRHDKQLHEKLMIDKKTMQQQSGKQIKIIYF